MNIETLFYNKDGLATDKLSLQVNFYDTNGLIISKDLIERIIRQVDAVNMVYAIDDP